MTRESLSRIYGIFEQHLINQWAHKKKTEEKKAQSIYSLMRTGLITSFLGPPSTRQHVCNQAGQPYDTSAGFGSRSPTTLGKIVRYQWKWGIFQCKKSNASSICPDKIFLVLDNIQIAHTKVLSKVKKPIFCCQKSFKMSICIWKWFFNPLPIRKLHLNDFWKQKMYLFTLDKVFVLDNLNFVQDKKYFVWADGRGISIWLK